MHSQIKYLIIYLSLLFLPVASVFNLAEAADSEPTETVETIVLDQAELDQILAPIALYPDTLLSHILVASTYPLEIVQAARWRAANEDLNEQQILDAVEDKDWDPSVKALTPFNDLLQKLSNDLDWLQTLGSAFLANEQQLLSSVQNLRKKAYQAGNLTNNQYVQVAQQDNHIVIETVRKEVIYVPYYDTRVVYGNWWWDHHQPLVWHRPRHSYYYSGVYWSHGFSIFPSFYFGGFHWHNRHVVANYHYHTHANRYWSNNYDSHKRVRVTEYPRWSHNRQHRRGAHYKLNGRTLVVSNHQAKNTARFIAKADKKRELNVDVYTRQNRDNASRIKQKLRRGDAYTKQSAKETNWQQNHAVSNKQKLIQQDDRSHKQNKVRQYVTKQQPKFVNQQQRNQEQKAVTKHQVENARTFDRPNKVKMPRQEKIYSAKRHTSDLKQNKRREISVERRSNSHNK